MPPLILPAEVWEELEQLAAAFGTGELAEAQIRALHYKMRCDAYETRYHDTLGELVALRNEFAEYKRTHPHAIFEP